MSETLGRIIEDIASITLLGEEFFYHQGVAQQSGEAEN